MKGYTISVILPCLNEEETIDKCIKYAFIGIKKSGCKGEVIVCDNGSADNSVEIAKKLGVVVVYEKKKGYGSACMKALKVARGRYIIMGDSDGTYDFREIFRFTKLLEKDYDCLIGSRLKGKILPGSMSWHHRYIGIPAMSQAVNFFYRTNLTDVWCGIRAFKSHAIKKMELRATGMEFALETIIKSAKHNLIIGEIPVVYYPRKGKSKLNTIKDGITSSLYLMNSRLES